MELEKKLYNNYLPIIPDTQVYALALFVFFRSLTPVHIIASSPSVCKQVPIDEIEKEQHQERASTKVYL